ncbi:MAG: hypothetical protein CRN43_15040 [Candidatus Nephrothrix sp. EaCA]|nr:MAG: hypothetical protein CRN43_15040 [Candidatus Nephrothrix sp. EaCA]
MLKSNNPNHGFALLKNPEGFEVYRKSALFRDGLDFCGSRLFATDLIFNDKKKILVRIIAVAVRETGKIQRSGWRF